MSNGDCSSFDALLAGVLNPDNGVRAHAESVYARELETQPAVVVGKLLRCLSSGQVRLMRRCAFDVLGAFTLFDPGGRLLTTLFATAMLLCSCALCSCALVLSRLSSCGRLAPYSSGALRCHLAPTGLVWMAPQRLPSVLAFFRLSARNRLALWHGR